MSKTKEQKPIDSWKCLTCQWYPEFDSVQEFKKHLLDVHQIETSKGQRKPIMMLDGAKGWFHNSFEWTIGPVRAHQISSGYFRRSG